MRTGHQIQIVTAVCVFILTAHSTMRAASANDPPVAEAGLPRYAARDPVQLDGSGSYDPDNSGPLSYVWKQISGPPLALTDADTATPAISGFVQTQAIQESVFELVVSDGVHISRPDTVSVIIVPLFGATTLRLENDFFDPNKPTFIFFGGGDCVNGYAGQPWGGGPAWTDKANIIGFPEGYVPDASGSAPTYYRYGDMIVTYLSAMAPDYGPPIQTAGHSTGGQPAIDVAIRLNGTYRDARYAVNRVSFLDATAYCRASYQESIDRFLASFVGGEPCWIDNYIGTLSGVSGKNNVLNVWFDRGNDMSIIATERHRLPRNWYRGYVAAGNAHQFNHGLVGGTFWSVIGPGKNLQLASTPGAQTYRLTWYGDASSGRMDFYDESKYPGRPPEPVTLGAWISVADMFGNADGVILSCHESENAVGYELLLGSDPYRVMDYRLVSDTPHPPTDVIRELPSEETWWTIRVRDRFGSTIYADPVLLDVMGLVLPGVQNVRTGKRYGLVGHAVLEAEPGDLILLDPGVYVENLVVATPVTVSSSDPNDPSVVAGTILKGLDADPAVAFSGSASAGCTIAGLTIQGEAVGVSCRDAVPTIQDCVVETSDGIALEFWHGRSPKLLGCTLVGQVKEGGDPGLLAYWKLDETEGLIVHDSEGKNDATVIGVPHWQPEGGNVGGALQLTGVANFVSTKPPHDPSQGPMSVFAWVKGGKPGQVIVSQAGGANWLMASATDGTLMTDLKESGRNGNVLLSQTVITDGAWHHVGLVWDGSNRILYVDDLEVARDAQSALAGSAANLTIGASSAYAPGTYWSGLIDDIRLYNRAVAP